MINDPMHRQCRRFLLAALLLGLGAWSTSGTASAQPATQNQALINALVADPAAAPRLAALEVAASAPNSAALMVGKVVGALPSGQRLSLAPRVVSAAIAALPVPQRALQAAAVACAAIRAVPAAEESTVVPAIVASAAAMTPTAGPLIMACAIQAVPELAAEIIAAGALRPVQPMVIAPSTSPQPVSTIGRDILAQPQQQACASPPCP